MRIEIDDELEKKLDAIRKNNFRIGGKGHSDTVRFLANFYQEHGSLEQLLQTHLEQIQAIIKAAVRETLRDVVLNLLSESGRENEDPRNKRR